MSSSICKFIGVSCDGLNRSPDGLKTNYNNKMSTDTNSVTQVCSHVWHRTGRTQACNPPNYQYRCQKCSQEIYSKYHIPLPECQHDWSSNESHHLGPNYNVLLCRKCGEHNVNAVNINAVNPVNINAVNAVNINAVNPLQ